MSEEEENEVPSTVSFFSRRAKLVAKVTAEELKATSELLDKIDESKSEATPTVEDVLKPVKRPRKAARNKKKASPENEMNKEDDIIEDISVTSEVTLSASAKKRLKKMQREKNLELQNMEAENAKILSAIKSSEYNEVEEVPDDNFDKVNVLTVSYLSEISRVKCYDNDKFSTIFTKVADLFNLKVSEFLLSFKEKLIKVEDTPKSLNITDSDILECIPYKPDENCETEVHCDGNNLKIWFQASDSKTKVDMLVHKLEKMQDVMEKYSKLRGIPLNLLEFEFDGEAITGTETPEDLDMESEICIDVQILTTGKTTKKKAKQQIVVTVDSDTNDSDIQCVDDF